MNNELPLFDLFNYLRQRGVPLGIDDYTALLRSIQAGFGIESQDSLKRLCSMLWIKNEADKRIFERGYQQHLTEISKPVHKDEEKKPFTKEEIDQQKISESRLNDQVQSSVSSSSTVNVLGEGIDPSQIVQAFLSSSDVIDNLYTPYGTRSTDYFPITTRQMKQSWRHLRRMVSEGPLEELDVFATVEKASQVGLFIEPVFRPNRLNHAELVLLIDQGGSMVPFHTITRNLEETARRGGGLRQANIYYFHDYPDKYLYTDRAQLQAHSIDKVILSFNKHTTLLIVSDAGAARGRFDQERIKKTNEFIQNIKQSVYRSAWMNPMPIQRWNHTTAEEISFLLPMFEMSRMGLDSAINALRGQYVYSGKRV